MFKRKAATLFGATMIALAALLPAATPAAAIEGENWGFVLADQPTTQLYEPANQASSTGDRSEVNRFGTGIYSVRLAGANAFNVAPAVTAAGGDGAYCFIRRYNPTASGFLDVLVWCERGTTLVDTTFSLSAFASVPPDSGAAGAYGYLVRDPDLPDNLQSGYSSTGQAPQIVAHPSAGDYYIRFFGTAFQALGGNAQVTETITFPDGKCAVAQWYTHALGVDVEVFCTRLGSTVGMDAGFSVVFANDRAIIGNRSGHYAYVFADQPTTPIYVPQGPRNRGTAGAQNIVSRLGQGRYQVLIGGPVSRPDTIQVVVAGRTADYCTLAGYTTSSQVTANVNCYTASGAPADDFFSLNYYTTS